MVRPALFPRCLAALVLLAACRRDAPAPPADAGADAAPPEAAAAPAPPPPALDAKGAPTDASLPAAEAVRRELRKLDDDPRLAGQSDAIFAHFGEDLGAPLTAHVEALPGDRQAILLQAAGHPDKPLVLVVSPDGTRAWTKERPLAGIVPGVREMTVVRGADSAVGLAFCDAEQKLAALRMWTAEGGIFADYVALEVPRCEALSALYWPGRGHILVASGEGEARAARIDERGSRAFGRAGVALPFRPDPGAKVAILVDTDESFVVLGVGTSFEGPATRREHAMLAMRYDERGKELWPSPVAVGRPSENAKERPTARVVAPGKIEVELREGAARRRLSLLSEGKVIVQRGATF